MTREAMAHVVEAYETLCEPEAQEIAAELRKTGATCLFFAMCGARACAGGNWCSAHQFHVSPDGSCHCWKWEPKP